MSCRPFCRNPWLPAKMMSIEDIFALPQACARKIIGPGMVLVSSVLLAACGASSIDQQPTALNASEGSAVPGGPANTAASSTGPALQKAALPAATAVAGNQDAPAAAGGVYKIGAQDILDVSVFKVPELTKSVQVSETGSINLPLVGEVAVSGKSAQDVERDLTSKLGSRYLQNPQVTVLVKEFNSQKATVEGAVKKPGVYPLRGRNSLLQLIATAEGVDEKSDATVVILRQSNGKKSAARFDLDAIRSGQSEDPVVQPGDVIVAGTSAVKEMFGNFLKVLPVTSVFALL